MFITFKTELAHYPYWIPACEGLFIPRFWWLLKPVCTLAFNQVCPAVNVWTVKINLERSSVEPNIESVGQIRLILSLLSELLWSLILQIVIEPP